MTDGSQYSNKSFVIIITTMLKNNIYIVKDRINKVFPFISNLFCIFITPFGVVSVRVVCELKEPSFLFCANQESQNVAINYIPQLRPSLLTISLLFSPQNVSVECWVISEMHYIPIVSIPSF